MQIFQNNKGVLTPIETDPFKLEIDIQSLIESNLDTLFGLELVSSEFAVGGFRLDSLAYDEQNNSFVVVEYKKGQSYSVVDQGVTYVSALKSNQADCILEFNEKMGKQLRRKDIDWDSTRVIFVSPSFSSYQENIINSDLPLEFWKIQKFESGLIVLEQQLSNSTVPTVSLKNILGTKARPDIKKIADEVKIPSEEEFASVLSDNMREVWKALRERLLELPNTSVHTARRYVSFKYEGDVLIYVFFYKDKLRCEIFRGYISSKKVESKKFVTLDDPKKKTRELSFKLKNGREGSRYRFILSSTDQLDYYMYLVNQKYKRMS